MPKPDIETHKKDIIMQLQEAGQKGLTKTSLNIKSSLKIKAFKELENSKAIVNLGTSRKTFYVLQEFNKPLEIAYELIETRLRRDIIEILSKSKINNMTKTAPSAVKKKIDEAVKILVNNNRLLKVKQGKNFLFLYVPAILHHLPEENVCNENPEHIKTLTRQQVLDAYKKVSQQTGFSNIEIYELKKALDVPVETLKNFIIEQNKQGDIILTKGDWSLYSREIRSAAVQIDGISYLLIRFKD
ncbi:Uncharacterized protein dnl_28300 [Desulfonema limicola]|uniref:Uncharacterized protein n=1 Tax=Desulfonema limicola TaxID=45656 RepID=A0A975B8G7_9BACT|nr:hypothetical protein [Desulfonema limicola]QTA80525.1 Uncharacterized protein dnl_28300 [Desulfonema limicola]